MSQKKERWIVRGIEAGMVLIAVALFLRAPIYMERTLRILTVPGEYRLCYYVPGELAALEGDRDDMIQSVSWEEWGDGTLLRVELTKASQYVTSDDVLTIRFVNKGKEMGSQEALSEEAVQWAGEYPFLVSDQREEGYYLTARERYSGLTGMSWVENKWDAESRARYGVVAAGGLVLMVFLELLGWLLRMVYRRRNQRYRGLRNYVERYLAEHWREEEHPEYARWIKKRMRHRRFPLYFLHVMGVPLMAVCLFGAEHMSGSLLLWGIAAAAAAYVWAVFWALQTISKINEISEEAGSAAVWCYYSYKFDNLVESVWLLADMNLAAYMSKDQNYQESRIFANSLWNNFGRKRKKGGQYLQYHQIQYRNCHFLGL